VKTNTPNNPKSNFPDSDETARSQHPYTGDEPIEDASTDIEGLQTSNKSGKHSSVEKLAASRPELGSGRGAQPVSGAFGDDESHQVTGRNAGPNTNQFRCNACGRYFNSEGELSAHEPECRLAKAATSSGRESLQHEDATPHASNDAESKTERFQHGTKKQD
jgi:hypothetical protein